MVDFTTSLGREVATPKQVFAIIEPEIKMAAVIGPAILDAMRAGKFEHDEDYNLADRKEQEVDEAVYFALIDSATKRVKQWATETGVVYDGEKLREFIVGALQEALAGLSA